MGAAARWALVQAVPNGNISVATAIVLIAVFAAFAIAWKIAARKRDPGA